MEVLVKRDVKDKTPYRVQYNFGNDVDSAKHKFNTDSDVVFDYFLETALRRLRAMVREMLLRGANDQEIADSVDSWRPTIQTLPVEKAKRVLSNLSDEEKKELSAWLTSGGSDEPELERAAE